MLMLHVCLFGSVPVFVPLPRHRQRSSSLEMAQLAAVVNHVRLLRQMVLTIDSVHGDVMDMLMEGLDDVCTRVSQIQVELLHIRELLQHGGNGEAGQPQPQFQPVEPQQQHAGAAPELLLAEVAEPQSQPAEPEQHYIGSGEEAPVFAHDLSPQTPPYDDEVIEIPGGKGKGLGKGKTSRQWRRLGFVGLVGTKGHGKGAPVFAHHLPPPPSRPIAFARHNGWQNHTEWQEGGGWQDWQDDRPY